MEKVELIDGNPPRQAAEEVGLRFLQRAYDRGENDQKVNMRNSSINLESRENYYCGTPGCHAGEYLICSDVKFKPWIGFDEGARLMANDLGFNTINNIEHWADKHPRLWGNSEGKRMFTSQMAFDCAELHPTLTQISDHWLGVAERLFEIQGKDYK